MSAAPEANDDSAANGLLPPGLNTLACEAGNANTLAFDAVSDTIGHVSVSVFLTSPNPTAASVAVLSAAGVCSEAHQIPSWRHWPSGGAPRVASALPKYQPARYRRSSEIRQNLRRLERKGGGQNLSQNGFVRPFFLA